MVGIYVMLEQSNLPWLVIMFIIYLKLMSLLKKKFEMQYIRLIYESRVY